MTIAPFKTDSTLSINHHSAIPMPGQNQRHNTNFDFTITVPNTLSPAIFQQHAYTARNDDKTFFKDKKPKISAENFNLAVGILDKLIDPALRASPIQNRFNAEYNGQHPIITALKILHKAAIEGSDDQRACLLNSRHKIAALNAFLADEAFVQRLCDRFAIEAKELQGMDIALPETTFEKMVEVATRIPRILASVVIDFTLLPVFGAFLLFSLNKPSLDPLQPKKDKVPILLLHGSKSTETIWMLGRLFLEKEQYGSVFSLNYDGGLADSDYSKGIDDFAAGEIRAKIREIMSLTGQNKLIFICHSMGGLTAGYYAEHFAHLDGIEVEHVVSIASPWQGAPILSSFSEQRKAKRYKQMSENSQFLQDLVQKALHSERAGRRKYYSIGSTIDYKVPAPRSTLTEDPRRQRIFSYLSHDALVFSTRTWLQIRSWLDTIYSVGPQSQGSG